MLESVLALFLSLQLAAPPQQQDEVKTALAHARALYYGARFTESIELLARVDGVLRSAPDRLQERIDTKLLLALSHIGLNETSAAKSFMMELYGLDSDYALDPKEFSPKVNALARDAQIEQRKQQCQKAGEDAARYREAGSPVPFQALVASMKSKCADIAALEPEVAELFYKAGLAAYKRNEFQAALEQFAVTLRMSPKHELATQYLELAQAKLQVTEERLLISWQRNFDARQFTQAAADYRQIVSANGSKQAIARLDGEYRKALSDLVDNWNRVCKTYDESAMTGIRDTISALLPVPAFGEDVRAKMSPCPKPAPPAVAKVTEPVPQRAVVREECLRMVWGAALVHVKTQVDPEITPELRVYLRNSQVTVRVAVRIDVLGNVTVTDTQGGNNMLNNAVRVAVSHWKFKTVRDQEGPRCVETEIPIAISIK